MQSRLDLPNGEALWENLSFIVSLFVSIAVFSDVLERCPPAQVRHIALTMVILDSWQEPMHIYR